MPNVPLGANSVTGWPSHSAISNNSFHMLYRRQRIQDMIGLMCCIYTHSIYERIYIYIHILPAKKLNQPCIWAIKTRLGEKPNVLKFRENLSMHPYFIA